MPPVAASGPNVADSAGLAGTRLRILIVGAGIAGATLAALLRRRGERPMVIERAPPAADGGYMLGLMPLGSRVLNGLGLAADYERVSCPLRQYDLYTDHAARKRIYPLDPMMDAYGGLRGIERGELIALLRRGAGEDAIRYEAEVTHLVTRDDCVVVTFDDGSTHDFDLVIAADGIHSHIRRHVLREAEVTYRSTGWGAWVLWTSLDDWPRDTAAELWSVGWGAGVYPVKERLGLVLAGRLSTLARTTPSAFARDMAARIQPGPIREVLRRVDAPASPFLWKMEDCRASVWSRGRVVLLGDAAESFLPTAGVGASMAMDSAAALADELARADASRLEYALRLYERRQRPRVQRAQANSRLLARMMFVDRPALAWLRDRLIRFYSLRMMIRDISRLMEGD